MMTALYRVGRQADALETFRRARHQLVDALGVEPGVDGQVIVSAAAPFADRGQGMMIRMCHGSLPQQLSAHRGLTALGTCRVDCCPDER